MEGSTEGWQEKGGEQKRKKREKGPYASLFKPLGRAQHLLRAESGHTYRKGGQETGPDSEAMSEAVSSAIEKEETEDHKFKASTGNLVRSCLKINRQTQPSLQSQGKYKTPARVF